MTLFLFLPAVRSLAAVASVFKLCAHYVGNVLFLQIRVVACHAGLNVSMTVFFPGLGEGPAEGESAVCSLFTLEEHVQGTRGQKRFAGMQNRSRALCPLVRLLPQALPSQPPFSASFYGSGFRNFSLQMITWEACENSDP